MAVVINEFEVVAEPERHGDGSSGGTERGGRAGEASTPLDLERIVRRMHERAARVRAD